MSKNDMPQPVTLEKVKIIFRNFSGVVDAYNPRGNREFSVVLDEGAGRTLADLGWNVKTRDPRDEDDAPLIHLPCTVYFGKRPPRIVMVTSTGRKTPLDEDTIGLLDTAWIENVDLIIRPFPWEMNGRTGIKAAVQTMFVTIQEDELEKKYGYYEEAPEVDE